VVQHMTWPANEGCIISSEYRAEIE